MRDAGRDNSAYETAAAGLARAQRDRTAATAALVVNVAVIAAAAAASYVFDDLRFAVAAALAGVVLYFVASWHSQSRRTVALRVHRFGHMLDTEKIDTRKRH